MNAVSPVETLVTDHLDLWTTALKRKSTAGRGSSSKVELYGIKKLRELILELAVRGLLVPQDPNDEPASELLKKIAAEKARLVKAGKIKKEKPLPPITEAEKPFEIPPGWIWIRLSVLCELENGDRSKNYPNKSLLVDSGIPFVNAGHLQSGRINTSEMTFISEERFNLLSGGKFSDGDILFCLRGSLGKSAIVEGFSRGAIASSLVIVRLIGESDRFYFHNFFDSPLSYRQIQKYDNGTAQPNLSAADLGKFLIPLPPLTEQHRLVAKVDELMALCDQLEQETDASLGAHQTLVETLLSALTSAADHAQFASAWQRIAGHFDTLFTTEESIAQLKQTILQLAVMGKLVPQDPNDEPASELLKKIAAEKAKLVKEGKIKKEKPLPPIADNEKPYDLPKGWEWVRTYQVAECRLGKMLDRAKNSGAAYPYLRNTNVQWQQFKLDDIKEINLEPYELEEYRLRDGDLLICEGGEPGRCAIWRTERSEMYFQKALHRVRVFGGILPEHIANCLQADALCKRLDQFFTGATIKHFAGQELNRYFFALPPLAEQHRIVGKVDELMALCDQLKSRLSDAQTTQHHLADALVERAIG
ncbi:MAG: restriction endonuclease subunit S [Zoogloea sp.]|uniref:restriction endonuclease subunit S n=1 Tax=Zoogloea sp. TaxID=49181 RepID=UPI00262A34F6|nr:restriction endonuclease subunit S [Zoogloea sp.]MDD2989499.1 restriction endonuclease subunit S [Zoogloea sp.]